MGIGTILIIIGAVVLLSGFGYLFSRYRTCPSDKVLVVYGQTGGNRASNCIHGGGKFVLPVIQDYQYLDLTPIGISVDLKNALSKQNIRVDVPSKFTVGISTEPGVMENAAERLLGQSQQAIQDMAKDIIFGQLRLVIAQMDIEEINSNRDKLLQQVSTNVDTELRKIGLKLINVNITDIIDESGYIAALGQEATAKAINDAKISVAEANKNGAIGESKAKKEQRIQVAQAEAETLAGEADAKQQQRIQVANAEAAALAGEAEARQKQRIQVANAEATALAGEAEAKKAQRIKVAQADSLAIIGENEADAKIAESNATLRERKAEAARRANTAEKIKIAQVNQESYIAEKEAENARAEKEHATLEADVLVKATIAGKEKEIQAQAEAEQIRIKAQGEADAIFSRMQAEARGVQEMLSKQAAGIAEYVRAAGGTSEDALRMMIADKIETLLSTQVEAIKNIKIDKVTVWDGGNGNSDSNTSTANFISGMMKAVPPMSEIFNMAGLEIPSYLGEKAKTATVTRVAQPATQARVAAPATTATRPATTTATTTVARPATATQTTAVKR